jgi:hypothetical protein
MPAHTRTHTHTHPPPHITNMLQTHIHTHTHMLLLISHTCSSSTGRFGGMRDGPRRLQQHAYALTHILLLISYTSSSSYHTHAPGSAGCAMVLDACSNMPMLSHLDLSSNGVGGDGWSLLPHIKSLLPQIGSLLTR